ncbi:MAG: zf-HC2 domain-containing protein [Armatimonadota bacterium]|nr:zf-HC2 domain-containing protein [bacterium]
MKCKRIRNMMGAYLYGDLEPEQMREVRLHTQDCEACSFDLKSRGLVISSLENEAPTLSDAQKQSIACAVRGALATGKPAGMSWWVRPASAVALASLVIAALTVGKHSGSIVDLVRPTKHQSSKAVVTITEIPVQPVDNSVPNDKGESSRSKTITNMADYARRMAAPAVTGTTDRKMDQKKMVAPEEPVNVASPSEEKEKQGDKAETRLPKPVGPNSVQTAHE